MDENDSSDVDDEKSDHSKCLPFVDQLRMCSDVMADSEDISQSKFSNDVLPTTSFMEPDLFPNIAIPSTSKSSSFRVCQKDIPFVPTSEQSDELHKLGVSVYDQTRFENEVMDQVDKAMKAQEEKKRVENAQRELKTVEDDIKFAKQRLKHIEKAIDLAPKDPGLMTKIAKRELLSIKKEQENKLKHLKKLEAKQKALQACISGSHDDIDSTLQSNLEGEEEMDEETLYHLKKVFLPEETEEERLIRTGEMTPFGTVAAKNKPKPRNITIPENQLTDFDKFLLDEAKNDVSKKSAKRPHKPESQQNQSKLNSSKIPKSDSSDFRVFTDIRAVPRSKKIHKDKLGSKHAKGFIKHTNKNRGLVKNYKSDSDISDFEDDLNDDYEGINDNKANYSSDDVYIPDSKCSDYDDEVVVNRKKKTSKKKVPRAKKRKDDVDQSSSDAEMSSKTRIKRIIDDGNQEAYIKRLKAFRKSELVKKQAKLESSKQAVDSDEDYTDFEEEYKIPNGVWNKLYKYQQTCVRWLWELHLQNCGGIVGDEMGLGKTIQIIAFLVGLKYSDLVTVGDSYKGLGPVILVCPATVLHQWVKEFHTWWPPFRVAVLHDSGSFVGKKDLLIRNINKCQGILITSYAGIVQHQTCLLQHEWHYIILDEGHKIRNPDAQATLTVKQFRTPHRLILSGSPVQNNLKELWSLFDFIFPGKLGTLPVFMQQFSVPIVLGGYANASQVQVQTAYKCATVLRDAIKPYLLRRMKSDVRMSINLPNKNEQVLFCQLTDDQANLYKGYINSKEVSSILDARLQIFVGLINLRKICNHPDIFDGGPKIFKDTDVGALTEEEQYGYFKRSGKMIVVEALLRLWHTQGHRVLLFTQSRQMMEILEIFVKSRGYTYMKMDGTSSIASRQPAINRFNSDSSIFVFILTTRVGGLGVNLTGANRVVLYDPDWNPSTDAQARERAWRIGQEKQVTIYRLLTAGTIEEKIYHRQIFKQFVTNRVLKDPRQRRFFKSNDLYELFTYQEVGAQGTETSAIFAGTGSVVRPRKKSHSLMQKENHDSLAKEPISKVSFSAEKLEQMKQLAKKLSLQLLQKSSSDTCSVSAEGDTKVNDIGNSKTVANSEKKEATKDKRPKIISKEKRSKKPRKRISRVEGEEIDFVVKKSTFKPSQDEEEKNLKQDDYVLNKLFKKSGVHTALKHDVIVDASNADYMIVEGEASRVATEAIKALKQSRRMCASAQEGIPTWTGQHGGAKPKFGQKKKIPIKMNFSDKSPDKAEKSPKQFSKKLFFDGKKDLSEATPSSTDLLAAIKKRKKVFGTDVNSDEDSESSQSLPLAETKYDELLVDIRNFIAFQSVVNGQASTSEILEAFKEKLPKDQTAVFKAMLKRICNFSRSSGGDGVWYLNEEFR